MPSASQTRRQSARMAYCSMAAALSVALMLLGGLIPIATYAVPMLCGLALLPVLLEFGKRSAWLTWAAAALLSLILGLDKEASFFYLFIGYYPIVKWNLDRIRPKALRVAAKLALFAGSLAAMYALLALIFPLGDYLKEFGEMGAAMTAAFAALYAAVMLLYDRLLFPMSMIYMGRIRPKLKFLRT